jgi:hypothetical protein
VNIMDARKWMLPAVALVGGAVLVRIVGLKGLVRVGMAALTLVNMSETVGLLSAGKPTRQRGNGKSRTPRKGAPQRRAHGRKAASVPASAQAL